MTVGNIVVQEFKLGGCCHWPFLSSVTLSHWKRHFPACRRQGKKKAMAREVSLSRQMTTVHPRNVPVPLILHVLAVGQNSRCPLLLRMVHGEFETTIWRDGLRKPLSILCWLNCPARWCAILNWKHMNIYICLVKDDIKWWLIASMPCPCRPATQGCLLR